MRNLSYPLLVSLQITDACNCQCKYCYNLQRSEQYISESDFEAILASLTRGHVFHVVLEGGEPLLHDRALEFCKSIHDKGVDYTLITNATLVTPAVASQLDSLKCNVIVSLDSIDPSINCKTRSRTEESLSGIECLLAHNVAVGINTVISRHNIDTCTGIIDRFYPRISRYAFLRLIARSQVDEPVSDLLRYSKQQLESLGQMLGQYKENYPDIKIISPFNFPRGENAHFQETLNAPGCLAGTTYMTIKPNLDVIPCSYAQHLILGNLRLESLEEIWAGDILQELRAGSSLPCAMFAQGNESFQRPQECSIHLEAQE